jgi:rhodanese-related sulfurtransferase
MEKLQVEEVKRRLDAGEPLIFVDARSDSAWGESDVQIPNSIRISPDRADELVAAIPRDVTVITYCT